MKRNRKRRSAKKRSNEMDRLERDQLKAFKAKFGRDPLPGEPIFFDPDQDAPVEIDLEQAMANLGDSMREAGIPLELIYAFEKTGLVLAEGKEYPQDVIDEYQAAIDEYFKLKTAGEIP
jgi:hypothetical protein